MKPHQFNPLVLRPRSCREIGKSPVLSRLAAIIICCAHFPFAMKAAVVTWTGAAEDNRWENPQNWDGQFVPGPDDDVVAAGKVANIRVTTAETVKTLTLPPNSGLSVATVDGSLLVSGLAKLNGVTVAVSEGASLNLPGLATLSGQSTTDRDINWSCDGAGSVLTIGGLSTLVGSAYPWKTQIFAQNSGSITFGGKFEVSGGGLLLAAFGQGSELGLPGLTRLVPSYIDLLARDGGKVSVPNLLEFIGTNTDRGNVYLEASGTNSLLEIAGLTNFVGSLYPDYSIFNADSGGKVQVKGDFSASGGLYLNVSGTNSILEEPGLKHLSPDYFTCTVQDGGRLSLPSLTEWTGEAVTYETAFWTSRGSNSVVDLPALTSVTGSPFPFSTRFSAENGATIRMGGDFTISGGGIYLAGDGVNSLLDAPGLKSLKASSVTVGAYNGARTSLPHLHEISADALAWADANFVSNGAGSSIEWGELTKFEGSSGVWVSRLRSEAGGQFNITGGFDIKVGSVTLGALGTGSVFSLPALRHLTLRSGGLQAQDGGNLSLPNLAEFSGGSAQDGITAESTGTHSVIEISGLTNLIGSPFPRYTVLNANRGGHLTLNGDYAVDAGSIYLNSDGGESLLEAPGLKRLAPSYFICYSQNGAHLSLPGLREWIGSSAIYDVSSWNCVGTNSLIDLPALTTFVGSPYPFVTRLAVTTGGKMSLGGNFDILSGGVNLSVDGTNSVLNLPGLKHLEPSSWNAVASAGGQLTLPHVQEVSGLKNAWGYPLWRSTGPGSLLALSEVAKFDGTGPHWNTSVQADAGGRLTINGSFNITSAAFAFYAQGAGSILEIPDLGMVAPGSMEITVNGGGRFSLPGLREFSSINAKSGFNWNVSGGGSVLEMPTLVALQLPPAPYGISIVADSGAKALLPSVTSIVDGAMSVRADGNDSTIDFSSLHRFDNYLRGGSLQAVNGGRIILPSIFGFRGASVEGLDSWGPPAVKLDYSGQEVLLAQPDLAVRVEIRPAGQPGVPWQIFGRVAVLTNEIALYKHFSVPPESELRVSELLADPPEIGMENAPGGKIRLTIFGLPGKTYQFNASPFLAPLNFEKVGEITLTHPFGQIDLNPAGSYGFFQVLKQ